jgi:hypothetical protein
MAFYPKQRGTTEQLFSIGAGTNKYTFTLDASTLSAARTWKIPDSNGSTGQVLSTDGLGNLFWATSGSGGTDFTVPYYLTSTETYTVNINRQALFAEDIVVDGTINIDGDLLDTRSPDYSIPYLKAEGTGSSAVATGTSSIALGYNTLAASTNSIVVGDYSSVGSDDSIAIGTQSAIAGDSGGSLAIGTGVQVYGLQNTAIGNYSSCQAGNGSFVFGTGSYSNADYQTILGSTSTSYAPYTAVLSSNTTGSFIPGSTTTSSFNQYVVGTSDPNLAKTVTGTMWANTTNATPTNMISAYINGVQSTPTLYETNTSWYVRVQFQGTDGTSFLAGTNSMIVKTTGTTLSLVSTTGPNFEITVGSVGLWDFQCSADSGTSALVFQCTGEAGKNIKWAATYTITQLTYA